MRDSVRLLFFFFLRYLSTDQPDTRSRSLLSRREPGQPGSRSSTPGRRRADRRSAARRWPPSAAGRAGAPTVCRPLVELVPTRSLRMTMVNEWYILIT